MKALIIIDMQEHFFNKEPVILNERIIKKIIEYKNEQLPIVLVEYRSNPYAPDNDRCGETFVMIRAALQGYSRLAMFGKDEDDGSMFLKHYVNDILWDVEELELVGVNLDCCVMSTAIGLAENHPDKQITILEECCDSSSHTTVMEGYDFMINKTLDRIENRHECGANLRMLV
jgi:nicotinamidase-related amidase